MYTSKSGDVDYEGRTGAAALWLSTLTEKCEAGEILYDLRIKENHAADEHKAYILLEQRKEGYGENKLSPEPNEISSEVEKGAQALPNFRQGMPLYFMNATGTKITSPIRWYSKAISSSSQKKR